MWKWNLDIKEPKIKLPTCNLNSSAKPISQYSQPYYKLSNVKRAANSLRFSMRLSDVLLRCYLKLSCLLHSKMRVIYMQYSFMKGIKAWKVVVTVKYPSINHSLKKIEAKKAPLT